MGKLYLLWRFSKCFCVLFGIDPNASTIFGMKCLCSTFLLALVSVPSSYLTSRSFSISGCWACRINDDGLVCVLSNNYCSGSSMFYWSFQWYTSVSQDFYNFILNNWFYLMLIPFFKSLYSTLSIIPLNEYLGRSCFVSSIKWSYLGHFLKAQGK